MTRTRSLPYRKSLGTNYNLRPDTEQVPVSELRAGDVIMESIDHPARISSVSGGSGGRGRGYYSLYARFVWQSEREPSWTLGIFPAGAMFDRAKEGEY